MGSSSRSLVALVVALAATGCGRDTGIVVEISMSDQLKSALDASGDDFAELRIWVGHPTDDPGRFTASREAAFATERNRAGLAAPFRYLLEPSGALDAIGPMVFAAGVGDDPDDPRLPFRLAGFAVADEPMDFGDGEVRVVPLALLPPAGARGAIDDACIVWGTNTAEPSRITPSDDLDCDGAVGVDDCNDLDPGKNNLDRDGDSVSSCAGDCMDDPRPDVPWVDPAQVHPGAVDPQQNDLAVCDHVDEDCDGFCQNADLDREGSGSTLCGPVEASGGVCNVRPADCDENLAGNQVDESGAAEACNGRDDACDGFLPPKLPCLLKDAGQCFFGEVACDEVRGEYDGEPDGLDCHALPDGFSTVPAPAALCDAVASSSCLESGDPVGCALPGGGPVLGVACQVSSRLQCAPDRIALNVPGTELPEACAWHVIGGTAQAEWEVGFVPADAAEDAVPMPTIDECAPDLAVRSKVANPKARSVVLLLIAPQNPAFNARPLVLSLDTMTAEVCSGALLCQFATPGP